MKMLEGMKITPLHLEGGSDALRQIVADKKLRLAELDRLISSAFDLKPLLEKIQADAWDEVIKARQNELSSQKNSCL